MEMQIACYYTLSTISQTLAGAFGFLVAIVLYRMQAIGGQLPVLAEMVINGTQQEAKSVSLRKMRARGQWPDFFAMVHEIGIPGTAHGGIGLTSSECFFELKTLVGQLDSIRDGLRRSMYATGGTLIACLIL